MKYFLLVYDQHQRKVESLRSYPNTEREAALRDRFQLERAYLRNPEKEVVLLGSDSRAKLRKTHGRYFETPAALVRSAKVSAIASHKQGPSKAVGIRLASPEHPNSRPITKSARSPLGSTR